MIRCTDPQGYYIELTVETWEGHICKGHPEMLSRLGLVKSALEQPQSIQGKSGTETCFYYRLTGEKFYNVSDFYVCVVVSRNEANKRGTVKTAHLLKKIKPSGDITLWLHNKLR